jgi:hypothetical protein
MAKIDIKVRELVDKVMHGELTLPEMQRRYVWPGTRVRDLLDSLYRGYPSGTILTWETDEDIETRDLAVGPTQQPTTSRKLLLLDGQQRITSLSAVLNGQPIHVKSKNKIKNIDILFNLDHPDGPPSYITEVDEEEFIPSIDDIEDPESSERDIQEEMSKRTFVVASVNLKNNPIWISVSDVFIKTDKEILKPIGINSDDERWDKYSDRLQKIRRIADYSYVMEVLEKDKTYEEVTEIFVRVNSLGIKLRGSDLAMAQITSKWKGFMETTENFAGEFKDDGDYILETGLPVRTLVIFATKQSRFKTVSKIKKDDLVDSWDLAMKGLRFAVNFVKSNAGVDDLKSLSSPFLLIPIAVYAVLKDEILSDKDTADLLRWFYISHMRGHYSMGSSESILDADLSILFKGGDIEVLTNQLRLHVKKFNVDYSDLVNKGIRSPFFSMIYFIFKSYGAKDWSTGISLSDKHVGRAHKIQIHHIFPRSLLREAGYDRKEINEISNLAFIAGKTNRSISNKEPISYLEDEIIKKRGIEALTSQKVPLDKSLWEIKNFNNFLDSRRKSLAEMINIYLENLDKESEDKNEDYKKIIKSGENQHVEFKSSLRWDYKIGNINKSLEHVIAKTISAFMNSKGGKLLVGVSDNGEILGIENDCSTLKNKNSDGFLLQLTQIVNQYLGKEYNQSIHPKMIDIDGMQICVVKVVSSIRPVFVKNLDKDEFYIRASASSQPLSVKESNSYIETHWNGSF